jgi:SAM-dependent methyltransferase
MSAPTRKRSLAQVTTKTLRELGRGLAIARDGGLAAGWTFVREEIVRNTLLRMSRPSSAQRAEVECNVCGWSGPRFMTHCGAGYVNYDCFCPRCMTYPRHRGFAYLLEHYVGAELRAHGELGDGRGLRLLFAPEPGMQMLLAPYVSRLEGVDHRRINELVRYLEDIQRLSFADGSVDFFSCFHVVEHVPDDRAALRELRRVLHPSGRAVFNVPITFGRRATIAFGRANPLANGHWFDHGEDFVERLIEAGFSGTGYRLVKAIPGSVQPRLRLQDELIFLLAPTEPGRRALIVDHQGRALAG